MKLWVALCYTDVGINVVSTLYMITLLSSTPLQASQVESWYSKTPIYRAPIYRVPRFTGAFPLPPNTGEHLYYWCRMFPEKYIRPNNFANEMSIYSELSAINLQQF